MVDILVALVLIGLSVGSIYSYYESQNRSYIVQDQVSGMQQNLRSGMHMVMKELRKAGYDPSENAGAGILSAAASSINFTMDITGGESDGIDNDGDETVDEPGECRYFDGDCSDLNENITYSLYSDGDGVKNLGRNNTATAQIQAVAENIEAVGFGYAFDSDGDGQLDTDSNQVIWAVDISGKWFDLDTNDDGRIDLNDSIPGGEDTGIAVDLNDIRAVRIWLLAISEREDPEYLNKNRYIVGNNVVSPGDDEDPENDRTRMGLAVTTVRLRNIEL